MWSMAKKETVVVSSADRRDLTEPRTRTVGFGPRMFRVSASTTWNELPSHLKSIDISPGFLRAHTHEEAPSRTLLRRRIINVMTIYLAGCPFSCSILLLPATTGEYEVAH